MANYRISTRAVAAEWRLGDKEKPYIFPTTRDAGMVAEAPADLAHVPFMPAAPPPPLEPIKGAPVLRGLAIRWDDPTTIDSASEGTFVESFARGAFTRSLASPMVKLSALYQHGQDSAVGFRALGRIQAWESDRGLEYEIATLPRDYAQDIVEGVKAGIYGGSSIRFATVRQRVQRSPGRSEANPRGLERRVIHQANLREISVVNWPAYSSATVKA